MLKPKLKLIKVGENGWSWECPICGKLYGYHTEKWQRLQSKGAASRHLMSHDPSLVQHGRKIDDVLFIGRFLVLTPSEEEELRRNNKISVDTPRKGHRIPYLYSRYTAVRGDRTPIAIVTTDMDFEKMYPDNKDEYEKARQKYDYKHFSYTISLEKFLPIQCAWKCPECGAQCGGTENHAGEHQCPVHYISEVVRGGGNT